ncbi:hypothetical protein V1279_005866 [Bradyrhizobium sp. AZCC 1610]
MRDHRIDSRISLCSCGRRLLSLDFGLACIALGSGYLFNNRKATQQGSKVYFPPQPLLRSQNITNRSPPSQLPLKQTSPGCFPTQSGGLPRSKSNFSTNSENDSSRSKIFSPCLSASARFCTSLISLSLPRKSGSICRSYGLTKCLNVVLRFRSRREFVGIGSLACSLANGNRNVVRSCP